MPQYWPSPHRAVRMVQRSLLVYKHTWLVIFTGFFEPLFYLLSLGIGLGSMVPDIGGINYSAFVAPGLLASSCMNGAITDGFFNIFFKLHFQKTYDGILATPMRVPDIALGEMLWAVTRGSLYACSFLIVLFVIGQVSGPRMLLSASAWLALPGAVLVCISFSSIALCCCSFVRKIQDFDIFMGLFIMPMFLFSGIFVPVGRYPAQVQWLIRSAPLYHGTAMLRQLTTGMIDAGIFVHIAYLIGVGAAAFTVAMVRLERALVK
jgi:lipooligosaccharide transport system permease protein